MAINQKIFNVMEAVGSIEKDGTISFGQTNYKYQSIEGLVNAIRPLMIKEGLIVKPEVMEYSQQGQLTTVKVKYTFIDVESGESLEMITMGQGFDSADKSSNKALSGALKYCLRQLFFISSNDDDPDSTPSESYQESNIEPNEIPDEVLTQEYPASKMIGGIKYTYVSGVGKTTGKSFRGYFPPKDRKDLKPEFIYD